MTIFSRLQRAAQNSNSPELTRMLDNMIFEGSVVIRDFSANLDDRAMQELNMWWVRAYQILIKCEGSKGGLV